MGEVTETIYYTVEFQSHPQSDLWLFAANEDHSKELSEELAREVSQRCMALGLGVRVYLHTRRESVQLVMLKVAA